MANSTVLEMKGFADKFALSAALKAAELCGIEDPILSLEKLFRIILTDMSDVKKERSYIAQYKLHPQRAPVSVQVTLLGKPGDWSSGDVFVFDLPQDNSPKRFRLAIDYKRNVLLS